MIELQLVGYTADLEYLVFCDAAEGASRFKASVDDDLLATLSEVVERSDPQRLAPFMPPPPPPAAAPAPPPPPPPPVPRRSGPAPGVGPLAAVALLVGTAGDEAGAPAEGDGVVDALPAARGSRLSPREIQALLRMGRSPAAVAKAAGVDESWVQRWLPPIEAERERIIAGARGARVAKARKGPSGNVLGDAVDRNLAAKNADADVEWSATRRDGDAEWMVAVRYRSRGKVRHARWRFDPETRDVEPQDAAARDLGWTPSSGSAEVAPRRRSSPAKQAAPKRGKTATGKKTTGKKTTGKKTTGKKTTGKKTTGKKATGKKATGKKAAAKNAATKRSVKASSAQRSGATRPRPQPGPPPAGTAPAAPPPAAAQSMADPPTPAGEPADEPPRTQTGEGGSPPSSP